MTRARMAMAMLATVTLAAACHRQGAPAIAYKAVGAAADELRRAFNADVDRVRVIMLVSPS